MTPEQLSMRIPIAMPFDQYRRHLQLGRLRWSALCSAVLTVIVCSTLAHGQQPAPLPDLSAATQKAQTALDGSIDLELNAPNLEIALGRIAAATGTPIRIDLPSFMSRQITLSQPVPARLKGESLRVAFDQLWPSATGKPNSPPPISAHEGAIHIDPFRWPPYPRSGAFRQGRFVVNGRVVDEADRPVPGAVVRLYCWAWVMLVATNDEGRFFATLPTNGDLSIEAWDEAGKRGWLHTDRMGGGVRAVDYAPIIKLKPPKQVTVRVTGADRKPVEGASVVLIGRDFPYEAPLTSPTGETTLPIPADLESDSVIAWKAGAGLDYTATRNSGTSAGPGGPPLNTDQPVTLELSKGDEIRFRVVDQNENAIADHPVDFWMLTKPAVKFGFNRTLLHGRGKSFTDANGEAVIDWLPAWQTERVSFSAWDPRYAHVELGVTPSDANSRKQTIRLERHATLRGQVLGLDGKPAPDVYVVARGIPDPNPRSRSTGNGIANSEGRFEFYLPPQRPYLIVALSRDGKQISPPEERVLEDPAQEIDDVVLYLRPAIRVFGRMTPRDTTRDEFRPSLRLISEDFRTRPDVKLPNSDLLEPVRAVEEIQVDLEPDGSFSLLAGPGRYEFVPVKGSPGIPFELTDQTEYQVEVPPL